MAKPDVEQRVLEYIESRRDHINEFLRELVSIPSVTGDELEIDTASGTMIVNGMEVLRIKPLPEFMVKLLDEGGLVPYLRTHMAEW